MLGHGDAINIILLFVPQYSQINRPCTLKREELTTKQF